MATRKRIRMKLKNPLQLQQAMYDRGCDTNVKAAESLGISHFTINELYHGRTVSPKTIFKIAAALGVEPNAIAESTD